MATLNSVIVPAKVLKGGRHKVRISVAHNGETRYIVTDIIIDSAKEFKNGQVIKRPDASIKNTKIRALLQKYQTAIDELGYIDGLTCPELVYHIQHAEQYKHRTISSVFKEYIELMRLKPNTILNYNTKYNSLMEFTGENMLIENVNHATVIGYDKFLREKRKLSQCTIRDRLVFLMVLLNYARRCQYAVFKVDPFKGYELPEMTVRQVWLSVDEIKSIRDYQTTRQNLIKCRDIFMLSYYLGGINMKDLLHINFNECGNTIHYVRAKTEHRPKINKFVEFDIPDEAMTIINRYKGKSGYIEFTRTQNESYMHHFFTYNMPILQKELGIKRLIYYSARKSFSQHAFNLGISTSTIDYILGHRLDRNSTSLYNYISVTPELATAAIRKVLDNLK